jgi:hypothetical protein
MPGLVPYLPIRSATPGIFFGCSGKGIPKIKKIEDDSRGNLRKTYFVACIAGAGTDSGSDRAGWSGTAQVKRILSFDPQKRISQVPERFEPSGCPGQVLTPGASGTGLQSSLVGGFSP